MRTAAHEATGVRTISGTVSGAGVVVAGAGFIVTKLGAGAYGVRFSGLRAILSFTPNAMIGALYSTTHNIAGADSVSVWTWNTASQNVDTAFSFVATVMPR